MFLKNCYLDKVTIFKAFCDKNRLMILEMLQSGEKCACVLLETLDISQPTLSHHMKILCKSGVVVSRDEGKWTYYSISEDGSEYAIDLLRKITEVTEDETVYKGCCE
ncbi:MAG: metalloregulator ArsR/SmtB family transcription factor [Synergistaceae bacterium]|jgi:ArsR family transcriptional regulator|nr:metalloregulator ArsR/SmtB family transcription factor [Synergistaceae bacterium]